MNKYFILMNQQKIINVKIVKIVKIVMIVLEQKNLFIVLIL